MKTETPPVPAALSRAFPELPSIGAVHDIGQGFGSMVVETGGNIIFRIGRSAAALEGYKREMRLLPELSGRVPVPIPLPRWFAERSPDFPFGVMGYWKIQGDVLLPEHVTPVAPAGLIRGLAAMLVALHGFPAGEALALDVPRWNAQEEAEAMEDDIMAILRRLLGAEECERIAAWWDTFRADPVLHEYRPRLIHGDLWYENLLVNPDGNALIGALDFEASSISDVAQDFATLRYLGDAFAEAILASYVAQGGQPGPGVDRRIDRLWEYRELPVLPYLFEGNHTAELESAIHKIRTGPILGPNAVWR